MILVLRILSISCSCIIFHGSWMILGKSFLQTQGWYSVTWNSLQFRVLWFLKRKWKASADSLFEMPLSTTVDEQNQFISGLTGNNLIYTMPREEFSLQDIVTSVTECILVAWILKNMRNKKVHLKSLFSHQESQMREPLLAGYMYKCAILSGQSR